LADVTDLLGGKLRRGGYIFVSCKSDHPPRHVHIYIYRQGTLVVKWDLHNKKPMNGAASKTLLKPHKRPGERGTIMKIRAVSVNDRRKTFDVQAHPRGLATIRLQ